MVISCSSAGEKSRNGKLRYYFRRFPARPKNSAYIFATLFRVLLSKERLDRIDSVMTTLAKYMTLSGTVAGLARTTCHLANQYVPGCACLRFGVRQYVPRAIAQGSTPVQVEVLERDYDLSVMSTSIPGAKVRLLVHVILARLALIRANSGEYFTS